MIRRALVRGSRLLHSPHAAKRSRTSGILGPGTLLCTVYSIFMGSHTWGCVDSNANWQLAAHRVWHLIHKFAGPDLGNCNWPDSFSAKWPSMPYIDTVRFLGVFVLVRFIPFFSEGTGMLRARCQFRPFRLSGPFHASRVMCVSSYSPKPLV